MCLVLFQNISTSFSDEEGEGVTPLGVLHQEKHHWGNVVCPWNKRNKNS